MALDHSPMSFSPQNEFNLLCSFCGTCDRPGRATFDPRGIICTNLVEIHKEMLHIKYQSSTPSSFKEEEF